MIQPRELRLSLPIKLANGVHTSTDQVWKLLLASYHGQLDIVQQLVEQCPELIYAQYNYAPPIHFAVREGHLLLVNYLLDNGALDPNYHTYPFQDSLLTLAHDRKHDEIAAILDAYLDDSSRWQWKGDNGEIDYGRNQLQQEFEKVVDKENLQKTEELLKIHPELATDDTYFWSEGILMMPAKAGALQMVKLLMQYGARVPELLKWTQFYYFERFDSAAFLIQNGMSPNTMNWHLVTILHDMAEKGNIAMAELLIKHGASINAIEEEYQSTPLGMAARWGQIEMVEFLLNKGADPQLAGATWSTPLSWSRSKSHGEIESILLKAGADKNV